MNVITVRKISPSVMDGGLKGKGHRWGLVDIDKEAEEKLEG